MGAALFSGDRLLSIGFNQYRKTHPNSTSGEVVLRVHAEQAALIKRRHYENDRGLICYVWRSVNGEAACSRPCPMCEELLRIGGVTRVRFVDQYGDFIQMTL